MAWNGWMSFRGKSLHAFAVLCFFPLFVYFETKQKRKFYVAII